MFILFDFYYYFFFDFFWFISIWIVYDVFIRFSGSSKFGKIEFIFNGYGKDVNVFVIKGFDCKIDLV